MTKTRTESDTFGPIEVPDHRYWGAQTERAKRNFQIGEEVMPTALIRALAIVKRAAAETNQQLKLLDAKRARDALQVRRQVGLFEPLHHHAFQRKERQEHVGVEIGDQLARGNRGAIGKVSRSEQALFFGGYRREDHAAFVASCGSGRGGPGSASSACEAPISIARTSTTVARTGRRRAMANPTSMATTSLIELSTLSP